ncbi:hypothetical protein AQUCO_00800268v1 [Aquilegia coerulea]|uniref:Uncharacterized protein n=1 Tax=Aquilegia coerulea TaxID=218851 RepID=A0A2G5EI25_AQUCA|nr:hypothetical protein AQUCO_00800268v1 [Aquilegia coerulea]
MFTGVVERIEQNADFHKILISRKVKLSVKSNTLCQQRELVKRSSLKPLERYLHSHVRLFAKLPSNVDNLHRRKNAAELKPISFSIHGLRCSRPFHIS